MEPRPFDVTPSRRRRRPPLGRRPIGRHAAAPAPAAGRGAGRIVAETLLTLGSLLGLAVTVATVLAAHGGYRPLVVLSGSMEPTIPTGSMVLVQRVPASELEVGDVVAVARPDRSRVTHRIVVLERRHDGATLVLKGDANEDADAAPVTVRAADRLVGQAPVVGRAAAWLATAPGGFAMGALVAAALMWVVVRRPPPAAPAGVGGRLAGGAGA